MGAMIRAADILTARGRAELVGEIVEEARRLACSDFAEAEKAQFSGDSVRDIELPTWIGNTRDIFPIEELRTMGLKVRDVDRVRLYATCGVDEHTDEIDGLSVAVVLHSDGFTFKSAGHCCELEAGDWFIFDDRLPHEALDGVASTTLLVLTCPLEPM